MGAIHHADRYFSVDVSQTLHDSTLLREHMTLLDRQSRSSNAVLQQHRDTTPDD